MTGRCLTKITKDERGASAVEMAISLPVLVTFIYGIFTLGQLFAANAGIQHALGEGARYGNLCLSVTNGSCASPTSTQLIAKVNAKLFGTKSGTFDTPTVDTTTAANGYVTISVTYRQTLNFLFFTGPTVTLNRSKQVYLPDPTIPTSTACADGTSTAASCSIYS